MHQLKLVKEKERKTFANMFDKVSTTHQSQSALKLKERREKPHAISNMYDYRSNSALSRQIADFFL